MVKLELNSSEVTRIMRAAQTASGTPAAQRIAAQMEQNAPTKIKGKIKIENHDRHTIKEPGGIRPVTTVGYYGLDGAIALGGEAKTGFITRALHAEKG